MDTNLHLCVKSWQLRCNLWNHREAPRFPLMVSARQVGSCLTRLLQLVALTVAACHNRGWLYFVGAVGPVPTSTTGPFSTSGLKSRCGVLLFTFNFFSHPATLASLAHGNKRALQWADPAACSFGP